MTEPTPQRYLAIKVLMMPQDTNPYGTIFGGVILSYIDQAGAIGAHHEIQSRDFPEQLLVTVALDRVEFHEPVYMGDIVSFWTHVLRIGKSSITMHVMVEAERNRDSRLLTQADVTYVAIESQDQQRRPVPIHGPRHH